MDRVKLDAKFRENASKHHVKSLRREGFVPANLSTKGLASVPLEVELHSLAKAMKTDAGINAIIDLKINGGPEDASGPVMVKEIQKDHLGRKVTHVTFQKVSMTDKFVAPVTVALHGEPIGVSRDSGILEQVMQEVEVKCLPTNLPPHFDVDVTDWEIGHILHASDMELPEDVELATDPEATVALVRAPHVRAAAEEVATEVAVEEAPAAEAKES